VSYKKVHRPQNVSVTLTILPENCDSQYTKNIPSDTLSALFIVCLTVCSADKIIWKRKKKVKEKDKLHEDTNLNTEHNNDLCFTLQSHDS
jgi:hypothetical protein